MKCYLVSEASSAIQALVENVRGSLYRFTGRHEILLKEVDPLKPIEQFGGVVSIRDFGAEGTQVLGLAGKSLAKNLDAMYGLLQIDYTAQVINTAIVRDGDSSKCGVGTVKGHTATTANMIASSGFAAEDCTSELILGWVMPAEYGTIYKGKWAVESTHNHYSMTHTSGLSMAVMTRVPVEIDWAGTEIATIKTNYLDGSEQFENDISDKWDEKISNLTSKFNLPLIISSTTSLKEVGMTFFPIVKTKGGAGSDLGDLFIGYGGSTYDTVEAAEAAGKRIAPYATIADAAAGRLINGMLIPRLTGGTVALEDYTLLNNVEEDRYRNALVNPPYDNSNGNWPETLDGKPAKDIIGHILLGVYASDSDATPLGDVTITDSFNPLNSGNYGFSVISTVDPIDENDTGEVNVTSLDNFEYPYTNLSSFGGSLPDIITAFIEDIEDEVESEARASGI